MMITTLLQRATIASLVCLSATAQEDTQKIRVLHKPEAKTAQEDVKVRTLTLDLKGELGDLEKTLESLGAHIDASMVESIRSAIKEATQADRGQAIWVFEDGEKAKSDERGYLGVSLQVTDKGAKIVKLLPGGGAGKAGLEVGDMIFVIGDVKAGGDGFLEQLKGLKSGQKVKVQAIRGDKNIKVKVVLRSLEQVNAEPKVLTRRIETGGNIHFGGEDNNIQFVISGDGEHKHEDVKLEHNIGEWTEIKETTDGKNTIFFTKAGEGAHGEHEIHVGSGGAGEFRGKAIFKFGGGESGMQVFDLDLDNLEGLIHLEGLEGLKEIKGLQGLKGIKSMKGLMSMKGLKGMHILEGSDMLEFGIDVKGLPSVGEFRVMLTDDDDEGSICPNCQKAKPSKKSKEKKVTKRRMMFGGDRRIQGVRGGRSFQLRTHGGEGQGAGGRRFQVLLDTDGDGPHGHGDVHEVHDILMEVMGDGGHGHGKAGELHEVILRAMGDGPHGHGNAGELHEIIIEAMGDAPHTHGGHVIRRQVHKIGGGGGGHGHDMGDGEFIIEMRAGDGHEIHGVHGGKSVQSHVIRMGGSGSGHGDSRTFEIMVEVDEDGPHSHGNLKRNRVMVMPKGGDHSFGWTTKAPKVHFKSKSSSKTHDGNFAEEIRALRKELSGLRKEIAKMRKHMKH